MMTQNKKKWFEPCERYTLIASCFCCIVWMAMIGMGTYYYIDYEATIEKPNMIPCFVLSVAERDDQVTVTYNYTIDYKTEISFDVTEINKNTVIPTSEEMTECFHNQAVDSVTFFSPEGDDTQYDIGLALIISGCIMICAICMVIFCIVNAKVIIPVILLQGAFNRINET